MVVTEHEIKLADRLYDFKDVVQKRIEYFNAGIKDILFLLNDDEANEKVLQLVNAVNELEFLIVNLRVIKETRNERMYISWKIDKDSEIKEIKFLKENEITERHLVVFIKDFEREFCAKIQVVMALSHNQLVKLGFNIFNYQLQDIITKYCER